MNSRSRLFASCPTCRNEVGRYSLLPSGDAHPAPPSPRSDAASLSTARNSSDESTVTSDDDNTESDNSDVSVNLEQLTLSNNAPRDLEEAGGEAIGDSIWALLVGSGGATTEPATTTTTTGATEAVTTTTTASTGAAPTPSPSPSPSSANTGGHSRLYAMIHVLGLKAHEYGMFTSEQSNQCLALSCAASLFNGVTGRIHSRHQRGLIQFAERIALIFRSFRPIFWHFTCQ